MTTNDGSGPDDELTRPIPTLGPRVVRSNEARIDTRPVAATATLPIATTYETTIGTPANGISTSAARAPYVHRFGSKPFYLFARLAAFAIDVLGIAFVLGTFAFHGVDVGLSLLGGHDASGFAFVTAVAFGAALLLAFLSEAFVGTTLGKLVFNLHVRRADGGHPGVGRVFVRALLRPIDALLIGPLLALVTPKRQRLGDLLGGTVVSESPLRWFAPLLGLAILAGVAYAQYTFGGGLDSAIGVAAETANDAPGLVTRAIGAVEPHAVDSHPTAVDTVAPQNSAAPQASSAP